MGAGSLRRFFVFLSKPRSNQNLPCFLARKEKASVQNLHFKIKLTSDRIQKISQIAFLIDIKEVAGAFKHAVFYAVAV